MLRTVGFPISHKENEKRRALIPDDIQKIRNVDQLFFETGYGETIDFSDDDYRRIGCHLVERGEVLRQDIICDPKVGDADYLDSLSEGQTIFGWVHAVQNKSITDKLVACRLSAYAWEDMFEDGRHVFWRNNEIAGEAAIMHAFLQHGAMPYQTRVAILGQGNIARGALKILTLLGADVKVYSRKTERLFQKELAQFDIIVNAILWDVKRKDHIIYREDLHKLPRGAMIIDVSCDRHGAVETSEPTTIAHPIYVIDGVTHYVVDHTPSLFHKTATRGVSEALWPYVDTVVEDADNSILSQAKIFENGTILDHRIIEFQGR